jgi:hypothetical protein
MIEMEEVFNEMQAMRSRAKAFLNGRKSEDLSDAEFDVLQEISGNNYFDHRIPEHRKIIENRKIFDMREEYIKQANNRSNIGSEDYDLGLNLRIINETITFTGVLATKWVDNDLYQHLVSMTALVHNSRKLQIIQDEAAIIADPDEVDMPEASINGRGVALYGRYAYDLNLDVTLDLREYDSIYLRPCFSFYFALKLSQLEFHYIDDFLAYQLKETFKGNSTLFNRFLTLLIRQKVQIHTESPEKDYQNRPVLTNEQEESVKEWIEFNKEKTHFSNDIADKAIVNERLGEDKKDDSSTQPNTYQIIHGNFSPIQISHYFSLLGELTNRKGQPLLNNEGVKKLQKMGLALPIHDTFDKIQLNVPKREKNLIYYYFYKLWEKNSEAKNAGKERYAKFIQTIFLDFDDIKLESAKQALRDYDVSATFKAQIVKRLSEMK